MTDQDIKTTLKDKLQHYEVPTATPYEWDELDRRLERKRFFRFAYNRFNIYYVCFIAAYGLVTTGLTILYIREHYILDVHEKVVPVSVDASHLHNPSDQRRSYQVKSDINLLPENTKSRNYVRDKGIPEASQESGSDTVIAHMPPKIIASSIHRDTLSVVPEKTVQELKNKKSQPLTVINRQDTIKKYDTVYVQKKRRFKIK